MRPNPYKKEQESYAHAKPIMAIYIALKPLVVSPQLSLQQQLQVQQQEQGT
jgi:hypothetical protein